MGAVACGASVTPTLQVQDGATNLGSTTWSLPTGIPNTVFTENFDGVVAPALPAGWTSVSLTGADAWTTSAVTPDTAPNDAFVNDPATVSDTNLVTPNIVMPSLVSPAVLSFRNSYNLEASGSNPSLGYDGGVLELKVGAGAFQDVIAAGGSFLAGGYNRTIDAGFSSPIAGRQAWSGNSGGYVLSSVQLPASVSGQTIQLRWRRATDSSATGVGWRVDTVSLQAGNTCCTPTANLSITKTDNQASYYPGQTLTYTIVASNAGPSAVTGATVADTFPANLTGVSWTCGASAGSACGSPGGNGNLSTTVNLLNGGSATFLATGTVSLAAVGTLSNTATITAPGGVTDPSPGNNSATDTDTRSPAANLGITKTDGKTSYQPGETLTYTIVVTNAGPDAVTGASVTDDFPTDLTGVTWTCAASAGSACGSAGGNGDINTTVNLLVSGSATFTATTVASLLATGDITNTASVSPPAGTADPTPGNNSATDTDTRTGRAVLHARALPPRGYPPRHRPVRRPRAHRRGGPHLRRECGRLRGADGRHRGVPERHGHRSQRDGKPQDLPDGDAASDRLRPQLHGRTDARQQRDLQARPERADRRPGGPGLGNRATRHRHRRLLPGIAWATRACPGGRRGSGSGRGLGAYTGLSVDRGYPLTLR